MGRSLRALRVLLVTDGRGDAARLLALVDAAVAGGVRAVQLREPLLTARELAALCDVVRPRLEAQGGVLLVNDRVDVAAAGHAHGAQVGHRSLRPASARSALGPQPWLGSSAHDARQLADAAAAGCDFALLSPIWPTASKPGAPALGVERAAALTAAAALPVLWLGGATPERAAALAALPAAARPVGIAVRSGITGAADVTAAAAAYVLACAWCGAGGEAGAAAAH